MIHAARLLPLLAPVVGGTAVLVWRFRETHTPMSARKIIMPPLGMSTGLFMFVMPSFRIPWSWAVGALFLGALVLSVPLMRSSTLERSGEQVVLRRSHGFLYILLGLLTLRLALHEWVDHVLPPRQTGAVFFLLAFGMILRWRVAMYRDNRRLTHGPGGGSTEKEQS